jgi:hypothetical protein
MEEGDQGLGVGLLDFEVVRIRQHDDVVVVRETEAVEEPAVGGIDRKSVV